MVERRSLGRQFGWLWAAYAVSTFGTWLAFDAFPLIAILVLHAGPGAVSMLAAAGLAVGAVAAVPLGPWVEFRRKRPVMVAMDLIRFAAVMSVPAAFALGRLRFTQLLLVSVVVAAADITFRAASGAYLKRVVRPEDLLVANGRFESTTWTAIALGPPLGGIAIGLFGPATTAVADAVSYLLSAGGLCAIGGREPRPVHTEAPRLRVAELLEGWRYILTHPTLRPLFFNTILLDQIETGRVARALSAWSITSNATIAVLTALWGLLASVAGLRIAIAIAGLLLLTTPLLLRGDHRAPQHEREPRGGARLRTALHP